MDGLTANAGLGEYPCNLVGTMFRAGENQHRLALLLLQQVDQQIFLLRLLHVIYKLFDGVDHRRDGIDLYPYRIAQDGARERSNGGGHGGREKECLLLSRQQRQQSLDVVYEAHVEHPVGFVQHKMADGLQADVTLVNEVEQTPRRGDEDIDTLLQCTDLGMLFHSSINHAVTDAGIGGILPQAVVDLDGQLTGGREDQCFDLSSFTMAFILIKLLNDGQCEGGSLAGACLCQSQYIAVLQSW